MFTIVLYGNDSLISAFKNTHDVKLETSPILITTIITKNDKLLVVIIL